MPASRTLILNQDGVVNWFESIRGNAPSAAATAPSTPGDMVQASTLAGAITGGSVAALTSKLPESPTEALLTRRAGGRKNIVPGVIMFSLFGAVGQAIANMLDKRHVEEASNNTKKDQSNFLQHLARSRFSPMTSLSDDDYAHMLKEKILRAEAEIALIDERIEHLRGKSSSSDGNSRQ